MLDAPRGVIAYAVLSFGGYFGLGDKLFAIPWASLTRDEESHTFILDVPRSRLEQAPGFDKGDWPSMADRRRGQDIHAYYDVPPYWEK